MRIAIDVSVLGEERTGIGNYLQNTIESLADIDQGNDYLLYSFFLRKYSLKKKNVYVPKQPNFKEKLYPVPSRFIDFFLNSTGLEVERIVGPVDVVHFPAYTILPVRGGKVVVSVHDLIHEVLDKFPLLGNRRRFFRMVKDRADRIIAISNSTKADLVNYLDISPEKIEVIYYGVSNSFRPLSHMEGEELLKTRYGIRGKFILFVGRLELHKNVSRLIRAFRILIDRGSRFEYQLVICGEKGSDYGNVLRLIEELNLMNRVIIAGHLPEEKLILLYNLADIFVLPSLYEGFGLPVLEAMACGTPVITSNISSLPEVVGDAARLIDPENLEEIAFAMEEVLEDEELRKKMSLKGLERAKYFSWENTARETLRIYREVCEQE